MTSEAPVRIRAVQVLYDGWAVLKSIAFDLRRRTGEWQSQDHLAVDVGDGATVLPYDPERGTVLLVRQFRICAHLATGEGFLIEACAGKLDHDTPEACAKREAAEELGYRLDAVERLFEAFMSPGALTERLTFFLAPYAPADRISSGGGHADEGEDVEVLELPLDEALAKVGGDIVDAKTILLLQSLDASGRIRPSA
jgi:nudix-type nucleoside diphosphatase (YffH/AdpP family)